MNWISVEDRLPEFGESILAWDNSVECICFGWYSKDHGFTETTRFIKEVTHWMPLPEPPEEMK